MAKAINLPIDWRVRLEHFEGRLSKQRIAKSFGVSTRVVERWISIDADFASIFEEDKPLPMDHDTPLRDRMAGLIGCHDSRLVKTLQVPVFDLVIVLKDARDYMAKVEDERRTLASELNRRIHADHVRNARGQTIHQSATATRADSYNDGRLPTS